MTKKTGRTPIGDKPMSGAERVRRSRQLASERRARELAGLPPAPPPAAPKTRRVRSDSATAAQAAMANADLPPLIPPSHVPIPRDAMPYWFDIIAARAREDWNPVDLTTAAVLAKCQLSIREEEILLDHEGSVTADYLGKDQVNPRFKVVEMLNRRVMSLMRTLRMGGKAAGDARGFDAARQVEGEARQVAGEIGDSDGLLA